VVPGLEILDVLETRAAGADSLKLGLKAGGRSLKEKLEKSLGKYSRKDSQ
jgi:hypothetical protein